MSLRSKSLPVILGGAFAVVLCALAVFEIVTRVRLSMLPWVLARGFGLASLGALAALSLVGIWRRHPLRQRFPLMKPATLASSHSTLAAATMVFLACHVAALLADRFAHVGVVGALIPMTSAYKTWPVALGTIGLWLLLAIWASARLSLPLAKRSWRAIHRISMFTFGCVWLHGLTTGTDSGALRGVYIAFGTAVAIVWLSSVVMQLQSHFSQSSAAR